ncbi:MAG: hypothetical protein HUK02_03020 [Bacteroidaceae bacterium]|nr:hypothetical protein [Bacteroidaceae bacterium]
MIPPYFNPSNDMALAANVSQYLPPRRIQQMERDLASLARFWDEGPWGWSLATRRHYLRLGVPADALPTDADLALIRRLSSREFACHYLSELLASFPTDRRLAGHEMRFATSLEDVELDAADDCTASPAPAPCALIIKSPWSSSGRGLAVSHHGWTPELRRRAAGMLRTQGGFAIDRFHTDKELDFAMEFWVHGADNVAFLGYSVFRTGDHGAYGGNVVASQDEILRLIDTDATLLQDLVDYHAHHLGRIGYTGPVGIDMMRLAGGRLHPVVEINLRRNMGILAIALHQQGLCADQPLTPPLDHGFRAAIEDGLLVIRYAD